MNGIRSELWLSLRASIQPATSSTVSGRSWSPFFTNYGLITHTFGLFEREGRKDCDTSLMDNLVNKMISRQTFTNFPGGWIRWILPEKKTHKIVTHKLLTCQSSVTNGSNGDSATLWGWTWRCVNISTCNKNRKNPTWSSRGFSNPKIFQFPLRFGEPISKLIA